MSESPQINVSVPSVEDDAGRFNSWIYGLEEVSSMTGLSVEEVARGTVNFALRGGYKDVHHVLQIERILLYSSPNAPQQTRRILLEDQNRTTP